MVSLGHDHRLRFFFFFFFFFFFIYVMLLMDLFHFCHRLKRSFKIEQHNFRRATLSGTGLIMKWHYDLLGTKLNIVLISMLHMGIIIGLIQLCSLLFSSRKHAYVILTPLNPTFI